LKVPGVLYRRGGNPDDLAAGIDQVKGLLDRRRGVHRVARDHRLDPNRIEAADADLAHLYLAGKAALVDVRIETVGKSAHAWLFNV
jgi:hypothetical protein